MIRRIATLLGLIGLAGLLCLAAALTTSGCMPVTQKGIRHELGPFHGRLDALDRKVVALEESTAANFAVVNDNFQAINGRLGRVETEVGQVSGKANLIVKRLGPIGRDASTASKEATAGRKATEKVAADVKVAHATLDQKVDWRADEVVGAVKSVDVKVDAAGAKAEAATAKAGADTVVEVGKVRRELSDHATEAERARQAILRLLSSVPPPPSHP